MNVNIKLSLTDEQRNLLKRKLTGKDVKSMVSRKEVNELVQDFIASMLNGAPAQHVSNDIDDDLPQQLTNPAHEQCCIQNALLLSRVNKLQHKLDLRK